MDFLHCRQTQPFPREYHTHCYVVEVKTLVELNPNILFQDVERMLYLCIGVTFYDLFDHIRVQYS